MPRKRRLTIHVEPGYVLIVKVDERRLTAEQVQQAKDRALDDQAAAL